MEEEGNKQLPDIQEYAETTISYEDLIELGTLIAKSLHLNKTHPKIIQKLLAIVQRLAALRPPIEIILQIINSINFVTPIEFLTFLKKFSSLNKHFRTMIKPHIADLVSDRFALDKESVQEFLELVFGRSGIPLEYLEELLNNKDKREKIKKLKILYESNPAEAIERLENSLNISGVLPEIIKSFLYTNKPDTEVIDIIMSLPKTIFYLDLGRIIKKLIDNDKILVLKMLIGAGINVNSIVWYRDISEPDKGVSTALHYAVDYHKIEIVKLLLRAGANDIKAITLAMKMKNQELLDLLISYHENKKL